MTLRPLEEDFRRMGLSSNEIREALPHVVGEEQETDLLGEDTEEDFEDDVYLSDLVDEEDLDEEDLDEDELEEAALLEKYVRLKKGSSKERRAAKAYYRKHKAQIGRAFKKKRKTSGYKRHQAKIKKMSKGSARTRRVVSDVEDPGGGQPSMHESLMDELGVLAESIEREPVSRFDEYVEAFNHIADLGEMTAMDIMEDDEEAAKNLLSLSLNAEEVLKGMEEMGGALDADEDAQLEEALADAMEDVGILFEQYGLLAEDDDDEGEDEEWEEDLEKDLEEDIVDSDNPFLAASASLREARGKAKRARKEKTKRKIVVPGGKIKSVSTASKWGKSNKGKDASRKQLNLRKDVRSVGAMLGYLRKVKAGKVAPGQPIATSKSGKPLTKGARAAKAMAGK